MNIKKITAKDNKEAFKKAVEMFGKDAIILSTKETMHGVEILASDRIPHDQSYLNNYKQIETKANVDYKQITNSSVNEIASLKYLLEEQLSSLIWENKLRKDPLQAQIIRHLFKCGYSAEIAEQVAVNLPRKIDLEVVDFNQIWQQVVVNLIRFVDNERKLNLSGIVAVCGANGCGKTTAIMKLATKYSLTKGTKGIAIVSCDTDQIGKVEELNVYSKILNIPAYTVEYKDDLEKTLFELRAKDLVLLDLNLNNYKFAELATENILVVDAAMQACSIQKMIDSVPDIKFSGSIITKVDYAKNLGEVLSSLINCQIKPFYCSTGNQIPDSLINVSLEDLFYRSLNLMDFNNNENVDLTISRKYAEAYINDN